MTGTRPQKYVRHMRYEKGIKRPFWEQFGTFRNNFGKSTSEKFSLSLATGNFSLEDWFFSDQPKPVLGF